LDKGELYFREQDLEFVDTQQILEDEIRLLPVLLAHLDVA